MADLAAKNREHFNKHASTHQNDFGDLIQTVIRELQARRSWISSRWTDANTDDNNVDVQQVKLLDYACGAGTVSKALVPFVSQAIGLDVSENMVAEYNKAAQEMGFSPERMHARRHDLLADDDDDERPSEPEFSNFDIATVSMALHHVADPGTLLQRLAKRLKKEGGVCVVLDHVPVSVSDPARLRLEDALPPEHAEVLATINKQGFTEEEMRRLYEDAGLGKNFDYVVIEQPFEFTLSGRKIQITGFFARGELL